MRKKELAILLSKLEEYENPKPGLEQYPTPGNVAAHLFYRASNDQNIQRKRVIDLGSGTGRLTIAAALAGAKKVTGIEIDQESIKIAEKNIENTDKNISQIIEFKQGDITEISVKKSDTVVQNPPFGAQKTNKNADREFLKKAFKICEDIYTIHIAKKEVRNFIHKFTKDHGWKIDYREEIDFNIPRIYSFHKSPNKKIKVDIYHIHKNK